MTPLTKKQFVAALDAAGITDAQKQKLHVALEQAAPAAHQALLEFLGISASEIQTIRERSRS